MLSSGFHGDVDDYTIGKLKTDAVQGNNLCDRLSKTFRRKTTPNFLLQLKTISCSARYSPNVLWIPQAFDEHWDGEQTHKWLAKFSFGDPFHETLRFFISEICNHSYQMKHSQARSSTRKAKKQQKLQTKLNKLKHIHWKYNWQIWLCRLCGDWLLGSQSVEILSITKSLKKARSDDFAKICSKRKAFICLWPGERPSDNSSFQNAWIVTEVITKRTSIIRYKRKKILLLLSSCRKRVAFDSLVKRQYRHLHKDLLKLKDIPKTVIDQWKAWTTVNGSTIHREVCNNSFKCIEKCNWIQIKQACHNKRQSFNESSRLKRRNHLFIYNVAYVECSVYLAFCGNGINAHCVWGNLHQRANANWYDARTQMQDLSIQVNFSNSWQNFCYDCLLVVLWYIK